MTTKKSETSSKSRTTELNQGESENSLKNGFKDYLKLRGEKMFPSITTEKEIFNLKINKYYGGDTKFKSVFSTNVFIPRELNLDHKSFSYLSGFIKLVETFKKMTSWKEENPTENWGLVIFCDKNLIDGSYINKITYKRKSKFNTNNNKILKEKYNENSDIIIKLYSLYNKYINHIIKNKYKYNFVKIYTFEDTRLKGTRGYLGLPSTYGSFIRFIPIFTNYPVGSLLKTEFDSIKKVFCINISHAITKNLMTLVSEWEEFGADICTMKSDKYNWENQAKEKYISTMKLLNPVYNPGYFYGKNYRIPAGLFGVVKEGINKEYNLFKNYLDILVGKYKTDKTIFNYSIDEILLSSIFLEELKRRNEPTKFFLYDDTVAENFKKLFKGAIEGYTGRPGRTIIEDIIRKKGETIENLSDFNKLYLEFNNYIEKTPDLKKLISIGKDRFRIYKDGVTYNSMNDIQIYTAFKKLNQKIQEEIKKNPNYSHIIDVLFTIYDYDHKVEEYIQCTDSNIILPYTKVYNETFVKYNPSSYINIDANHIYLSREFMNYIGKDLEDYFKIRKGNRKYNFSTLLQSGFDEIKPLILYSKNFSFDGVNFNYYLELICIDDYKNTELNKLLNIIIRHYNNTDNLVVEGYKKKSSSKKKKSNKKKSNKNKKTLKSKII